MAGNPLMVFEDVERSPRRRLFILFGVPVNMTPLAPLNVVTAIGGMFVLTFLVYPNLDLGARIGYALLWAVMFLATAFLHSIGHILGGRAVNAPMDELLLTMTRQANVYRGDQSQFPPQVHLARAAGGPLANIAAGLVGLLLVLILGASPSGWLWVALNLAFGFGSLAPVESVDGAVIWPNLALIRRQSAEIR